LLLGGFLDFETPSLCGRVLVLLFRMPDLFAACLDFTVEVLEGAMSTVLKELRSCGLEGAIKKEIFWMKS